MSKKLTPRKRARLLREARAYIEPFGIDLSLYGEPEIEGLETTRTIYDEQTPFGRQVPSGEHSFTVSVVWSQLADPEVKIELTQVWWHEDTGAILQAGSSYGYLSF